MAAAVSTPSGAPPVPITAWATVPEPALLGSGQDRDRVGGAGSAEVRPFQGIDGDVDRGAGSPAAHLLADEQHGGLVALPLADDDGPVYVDGLHLLAHGLDRNLV